jgi:uncharacterized membrane protein HdeD (DUF308 family)
MSPHPLHRGIEEIARGWFWFLLEGVGLIVLGVLALLLPWVAGGVVILLIGFLLILGGVFEAIAAFGARRWSGFFLHLFSGVLSVVVGTLIALRPGVTLAVVTLLLAAMFLVSGLFHIAAAAAVRFPNWGWMVLDGVIAVILGALIWAGWPESAEWVIGTFVGIDLIFRGLSWVQFALALRRRAAPAL